MKTAAAQCANVYILLYGEPDIFNLLALICIKLWFL